MAVCPLGVTIDDRRGPRTFSGRCKMCGAQIEDVTTHDVVFAWFEAHVCSEPQRRDAWRPFLRKWRAENHWNVPDPRGTS